DVYPFLALAKELKRRGHFPVIATMPVYRQFIEGDGIGFHPVRPDIGIEEPEILRRAMDLRSGGRYIICDLLFPGLRDSYADTAAAAVNADLLVTHPMTFAASLLARKTGIPWASIALAPMSLYSIYDPPLLAGFPCAGAMARLGPTLQRQL